MSSYEGLIEKSILVNQAFNCTQLSNLQIIETLQSYHDRLLEVATILENGFYSKISEIKDFQRSFDYLTIIKFIDQNQNIFYGIVYDSDELWQDPVVTQIFPLVPAPI